MDNKDLKLIIKEGEGLTVEFKEKFTPKIDRDIVALANTKGGFIVFGVNDSGEIIGERLTGQMKAEILSLSRNCDPHITIGKISQIDDVIVIEVREGDEKPYSCSSGYFRRLDAVTQKMSQKEVRAIFRETADIFFESLPCKDFGFKDVSLAKAKKFLKETKTSFRVNKNNLPSFFASLSLYKDNKINNAGALMFARDINQFIPYSEVILGAFKGIDKTYIYDRKDVRDDLLTQLNESMAFIKRQLNVRSEIHELNRIDIYELPLDALREALVNAIIHRDYSMRGTSIYVGVFDDRVEIENPGGLPPGLPPKDFGKTSVRRNLIIADIFHRMAKVEKIGSGIRRMRDFMRKAGLREPHFEMANFFRAIFYRNPEYSLKPVAEKSIQESIQKGIQKSNEKVLGLIKDSPSITTYEMAESLGMSRVGIAKVIKKLKERGQIKRIGPDKGGYWEVSSWNL